MFIHALISSVRTSPEPAVFLILHSLDKVFAHLVRRRLRIAVLARHHFPQLLLVPHIHRILFLHILLVTRILVKILLFGLPLHIRIVTEFAFPPLFAVSLLKIYAEHSLRVDTEWDLLCLDRLEKLSGFPFGLLGCCLILLTLGLFCFLAFGLGVLIRNRLGLELGDLFLC